MVTKITNFGVFVGLEDGLEGLLHISELADHKVDNPEDVVKVGQKVAVQNGQKFDAYERRPGEDAETVFEKESPDVTPTPAEVNSPLDAGSAAAPVPGKGS